MCLVRRLYGEDKKKAIAKLPKTFMVWKFCLGPDRLQSEYHWGNDQKEPQLKIGRRTKAKYLPAHRQSLPYLVDFHAFLEYKQVCKHYFNVFRVIRKFEVRKADIKEIGRFNDNYYGLKGVVLSHIKPV